MKNFNFLLFTALVLALDACSFRANSNSPTAPTPDTLKIQKSDSNPVQYSRDEVASLVLQANEINIDFKADDKSEKVLALIALPSRIHQFKVSINDEPEQTIEGSFVQFELNNSEKVKAVITPVNQAQISGASVSKSFPNYLEWLKSPKKNPPHMFPLNDQNLIHLQIVLPEMGDASEDTPYNPDLLPFAGEVTPSTVE